MCGNRNLERVPLRDAPSRLSPDTAAAGTKQTHAASSLPISLRYSCRLVTGIVSTLGADHEFAVAVRFRVHFHASIPSSTHGRAGLVPDGVLVANIMGNGTADGVHFVKCLGMAVSSPSVTTKMTFFSSLPRFSQSAEATTAS